MRRLRLFHGVLLAAGAGLLTAAGACGTPTVETSLRALEESGRISFVCISANGEDETIVLPLSKCRSVQAESACDFASDEGGAGGAGAGGAAGDGGAGGSGTAGAGGAAGGTGTGGSSNAGSGTPHLYGLVTQTFRGEVAVIDFTTQGTDKIVDQDATVPGPSFLPIGGQPVGIVSTPGGTATFVTVAEVGRQGIFAIPSTRLARPRIDPKDPDDCTNTWPGMPPPPRISSWPACSLPAAPGEPILINDPADELGRERASCDDLHEVPATGAPNGDLTFEEKGRQKIVVPIPALGGVAIIDAQKLLDQPDGSFDPCPVDRWVLLDGEVPTVAAPQPATGPTCASPAPPQPAAVAGAPLPSGMAFAEGMLYVSDLTLPLIHRFVMDSPCEPVLLPPLLPTAIEEPERTVTTSRVAVTPQATAGLKRYLYANDVGDGTVMVFDVSDGATTRTPLVRSNPEWTPLQPRDRLRFVSAPRDLIVVSRDIALETPGTGAAPEGTFCDPDPALTCCDADLVGCSCDTATSCNVSTSCDPATQYRPYDDFSLGAGPYKLRGTFGFVLLTNGQIEIIEVEDLDGPCRSPSIPDPLLGCEVVSCVDSSDCGDTTIFQCTANATEESPGFCERKIEKALAATNEASCNVTAPNNLRGSTFLLNDDQVGFNRPGITSFPLLFDRTGALLDTSDNAVPAMRATMPLGGGSPPLSINGDIQTPRADGAPSGGIGHILAMNLENPRAHTVNQAWTVTFEGPLPRYGSAAAELRVRDDQGNLLAEPSIYDSNGLYCDGGVQSYESVRAQLTPVTPPTPEEQAKIDKKARLLADNAQIVDLLAEQDDDYWDTTGGTCNFTECRSTFGDGDTVLPARDFMIREAYQDRLVLQDGTTADGGSLLEYAKCCFPSLVSYYVRPANQWVVVGQANGFMHHVIPDAETGVCRPSCDPVEQERMNGRVVRTPSTFRSLEQNGQNTPGQPVFDRAETAFINQMFRFAIVDGVIEPDPDGPYEGADPNKPQRDMQIRFGTTGSFSPLTITLLNDTREIAPVGITLVPPTGELAVTDGALQGVITVTLAGVQSARQFF